MADNDTDNINLGDGQNYLIQSHYETGVPDSNTNTGHYQLFGLAYDGTGETWDIGSLTNPYPIQLPASTTVGSYIADVWACIGTAAGGSCMNVDIVSSAGLTVNAVVADVIIGVTNGDAYAHNAQMVIYGTGGTAVGVTGTVNIAHGLGGLITISGDTAVTGSVYNLGTADVWSSGGVQIYGSSAGASPVGVTGQVKIADGAGGLVSISGGVSLDGTPLVNAIVSTSVTSGIIASGLQLGSTLGLGHGFTLSSGVRVQAFDTGSDSHYIYVGGNTSTGLSGSAAGLGIALREFDSVFIEVDNTNKVFIASDNSTATVRYVGS